VKYQKLKSGEKIRLGDQWFDTHHQCWRKASCLGDHIDGGTYRRPVKPRRKKPLLSGHLHKLSLKTIWGRVEGVGSPFHGGLLVPKGKGGFRAGYAAGFHAGLLSASRAAEAHRLAELKKGIR
jgi:hypothetical protein